jgi:hypothetical protein
MSFQEKYDAVAAKEAEERQNWRIVRQRREEVYFVHSGRADGSSYQTVWKSRSQRKLFIIGSVWYVFQMLAYMVMANYLVYLTFHMIPPTMPSYPGKISVFDTPGNHSELFDTGFLMTPDLSYRPFWLKTMFVDMMVSMAQAVPPMVLLYHGQTFEFICYTGTVGILNLAKGVLQIATILPPANGGDQCWKKNFGAPGEIKSIRGSFLGWWYQNWGMTHGCNDMLWSGHTSQSCLGILFIDKILREKGVPRLFRSLLFIYFLVYIFAILSCRMHYTIDVFVAILVAMAFFTHGNLRFWIWSFANHLVQNDPKEKDADESRAELLQSGPTNT